MFKFGSERIVQSIEVFIEAEMQKKDAEVKKKAASLCLNDLASVDDPLMDWFTNHVCRFLAAGAAFFPVHFVIIQMWKVSLKIHPKRQEFDLVFCFNMFPLKKSNDPSSPGYRGSNEEC